jgi:3-hydroxyacyl-CoA dehydrogenase / enoyl-CoA hydratase / 3-hydroxybutyryl-CoA epimerase
VTTQAERPQALRHDIGDDGIMVVTLDVPGERVNTLSRALLGEFESLIADLEGGFGVTGVVLASGKPDGFIAGADIRDFTAIRSAREAEELSRTAQALLDRLARLPLPVVAAIHGPCLGGGLEVALACRYRVASDDARTVVGQPEIMLGLIPGAGGTQRLPRLAGLATGLDLVLTGRSLKARRALKAGIVDEVVPAGILVEVSRRAARRLAERTLEPRRPGISLQEKLLRPLIFRKAEASVREKAGRHYPAPYKAIEVIREGTARGMAEGLALEARAFGELAVSDVSRALVSVFFATQEIKKDLGVPEGTQGRPVRKLGVVGAGLMGSGIAAAAAEAGALVRLRDTTVEALGRGLREVRGPLEERRGRGSLTALEVAQRLDRISVTVDYSGFRRTDLVIEAVFEDLDVKRAVLAEVEGATPDDGGCVFASNTSAIPISRIAEGCRRPSRVLGMHFFSPVAKMPLLEVVVTPETDAWATATAVEFGRKLGKHVIVVRDGPGFYTTRTLAPYLDEAARLVEEGVAIEAVDRAATDFGFPVGPLVLLDEVGIDVGAKVAQVLHEAFGERLSPPAAMARVLEDGRQGRKNKRGFYLYDGRKKRPDPSLYALLGTSPRAESDPRELQDRLAFAFLGESVRCLEDGILRSPRDGDVGAVFGLGFPPFRGGPFRYLDHLGARFAVEVLERLAARHGERFTPPGLLVEMAREGVSFYS